MTRPRGSTFSSAVTSLTAEAAAQPVLLVLRRPTGGGRGLAAPDRCSWLSELPRCPCSSSRSAARTQPRLGELARHATRNAASAARLAPRASASSVLTDDHPPRSPSPPGRRQAARAALRAPPFCSAPNSEVSVASTATPELVVVDVAREPLREDVDETVFRVHDTIPSASSSSPTCSNVNDGALVWQHNDCPCCNARRGEHHHLVDEIGAQNDSDERRSPLEQQRLHAFRARARSSSCRGPAARLELRFLRSGHVRTQPSRLALRVDVARRQLRVVGSHGAHANGDGRPPARVADVRRRRLIA